jgi:hypothetical protein
VLRWIQETDSSRLLFDEVAHDFLRIVFYPPFTVCAPLEDTSVANRFDLPANRGNMAGTRRNCPDCMATATSRMPQPEACSTSLRSIRFLKGQWEIVVWESWGAGALRVARNPSEIDAKRRSLPTSRHRY